MKDKWSLLRIVGKKWVFLGAALAVGSLLLNVMLPSVLVLAQESHFSFESMLLAAILVVSIACSSYLSTVCAAEMAERLADDYRRNLFEAFIAADYPTQEAQAAGSLVTLVDSDVEIAKTSPPMYFTSFLPGLSCGILIIGMLAYTDLYLTMAVAALILFAVILIIALAAPIRYRTTKTQQAVADLNDLVSAVSQQNLLVKGAGCESWVLGECSSCSSGVRKARVFLARAEAVMKPANLLLTQVVILGVALLLYFAFSSGYLDSRRMFLFSYYGVLLLIPVGLISEYLGVSRRSAAAAERIDHYLQLLSKGSAQSISSQAPAVEGGAFAVSLDDVYVALSSELSLGPFDVRVSQGRVTFVRGPNGCGKSTLLKALAGVSPIRSGQLVFGSVKQPGGSSILHDIRLHPQDAPFFPGTVKENLSLGVSSLGDDVSLEALNFSFGRDVSADVLNMRLGRCGVNPSGGEKQMISWARALCVDSNLILFDEPVSGVDAGGIERFVGLIDVLLARRCSVVVVSHGDALESLLVERLGEDRISFVDVSEMPLVFRAEKSESEPGPGSSLFAACEENDD